jgi:hypothetical protein
MGSEPEAHETPTASQGTRRGGVSNVDIDGNNALQIKAIGVVISTFETLPLGYATEHLLPQK